MSPNIKIYSVIQDYEKIMFGKLCIAKVALLFLAVGSIFPISSFAEDTPLAVEGEKKQVSSAQGKRDFRHVVRDDISLTEKLATLGIVYGVQWSYYLIFQWDTIQSHGSFKNWYSNMYQPHFDRDSYNYNLILHTLAGNYYYLFFRSRGHTKVNSVLWAALSQLLFEFTIEVITEPPSWQDMYQTPIFGSILGMGMEFLSAELLSTDSRAAHVLGYILNPFAMFPFSSYSVTGAPLVSTNFGGYVVRVSF